jgi:quinohemoprotein amine dehydrogenase
MKTVPGAAAALVLVAAAAIPSAVRADADLLAANCGGCHAETEAGLSRIAGQRKTPEGWLMTIVRMRIAHGVEIDPADQAAMVAHLAETQGLAPSETVGWRYALEKDPDVIEGFEEPLRSMCARCHTGARAVLQARTAEEWDLLVDFHVGQFPTVEYQALGRDRQWYRIAKEEIAPMLAAAHPFESEAWTAWQAAEKLAPAGDWVVLTELPGRGRAYGRLSVAGAASPFEVTGELRLADGATVPVAGSMNLYTGYEWRANLDVGEDKVRQVLAMSQDGTWVEGRQFLRDRDSLGARLVGARADGPATVLGAVPEAGQGLSLPVQLVGVGLDAATAEGGAVEGLAPNDFGAAATVTAAAQGVVTIAAGDGAATVGLWEAPDRVAVEPAFTVARIGGGGEGAPAAVPARFKAIGFWNGPDGAPGTGDDVRIGELPATWSVDNLHETAAMMEDTRWTGVMEPTGVFLPAIAGPNPERPFSTNNAGELKVIADAAGLKGEGTLIVTVQRFIDPPIR